MRGALARLAAAWSFGTERRRGRGVGGGGRGACAGGGCEAMAAALSGTLVWRGRRCPPCVLMGRTAQARRLCYKFFWIVDILVCFDEAARQAGRRGHAV